MKLSYIYAVTADGAGSKTVEVNVPDGAQWRRLVDDNRTLWKQFRVQGRNIALSIAPGGLLMAVAKLGGSRDGDNVTVWVYVPGSANASGKQLEETVDRLNWLLDTLGTSQVEEETFLSDPILNRDYTERQRAVPKVFGSRYGKLAYRKLDDLAPQSGLPTLREVLDAPFQRSYAPYQFLFLLGEPGAEPDLRNAEDLTTAPIDRLLSVYPPELPVSLAGGKVEIQAASGEWTEFAEPVQALKTDRLRLRLTKPECEPVEFNARPYADGMPAQPDNGWSGLRWMRKVPKNPVRVIDESGKELRDFELLFKIDGSWKEADVIPESQFGNALVKIVRKGYLKETPTLNLNEAATSPKEITLKRDLSANPRHGKGKHKNNAGKWDGRQDGDTDPQDFFVKDRSSGRPKSFWFALGAAVLVVVGVAVAAIWLWSTGAFDEKELESPDMQYLAGQTDPNPTDQGNAKGGASGSATPGNGIGSQGDFGQMYSLEEAIRYLDTHAVWDRNEMAQYPDLAGLYASLNSFELNDFGSKYFGKLASSKRMQYLAEHVKQYLSQKRNAKIGAHSQGWNPAGAPEQIDVTRYASWINNQCEKAAKATPAPKPSPSPAPTPRPNPRTDPEKKNTETGSGSHVLEVE